jgi:hypothetical protein
LDMTSNSLPTPYVASASHAQTGANGAYGAFDATTDDGWKTTSEAITDEWLMLDLGASNACAVNRAILKTSPYADWKPHNYKIDGSNDGTNWDNLLTVASPSWTANKEDKTIENTTSYRYYRISDMDNPDASILGLVQVEFYSTTSYAANDLVSNDGSIYMCSTAHVPEAGNEPGVGASWSDYWELWVSSGTSGTSSNGSSGTSGTSGVDGSHGTSGTSGSSGTNGSHGSSGTSGTDGSNGTSGTSGTSGSSGTSGTDGSHGTSGTSGTGGTSGTSGTGGSSGTSGNSGSSGTSGVMSTNSTCMSVKITGNYGTAEASTAGTCGYVVNVYFGTAATMGTTGVPDGSIYIQYTA